MPAAPICAGRGLGVRDVEFRKTALRIEHKSAPAEVYRKLRNFHGGIEASNFGRRHGKRVRPYVGEVAHPTLRVRGLLL